MLVSLEQNAKPIRMLNTKIMKLTYQPYQLNLKYPFTIAHYSRTHTPLILLQIEHEGITGFGEASMVPYMGENFETASIFLKKVDVSWLKFPLNFDEVITYLDCITPGHPAIKAAIDIALHDLEGKIFAIPCYKSFGSQSDKMPVTSITIGMDTPQVIVQKVLEAKQCKILKVKLGGQNDKALIETIRSISNLPLYVDANQGWTHLEKSLDFIYWLKEQGVLLIEQPMPKNDITSNSWLTENSPIPIIGDEAVQRLGDVSKASGVYHGINIKLMKSAGMHEAHQMILKARDLNLKVLIGCMSETSCATLASAALAPLCDWADLDGPFLTKNNPYGDPMFRSGKWVLTDDPGLGLVKKA
ncbi:MAG: dipeptide epimerase [Sphingobacteriales bacterium]|nr:dipeptide epimerase [Sphingobacteriales bacterium]